MDEAGENGASATKTAENVAGGRENGASATKRAENVAGSGENGASGTKKAENVDEQSESGDGGVSAQFQIVKKCVYLHNYFETKLNQ